jgi:hypothetical protein
LCSAVPSEYSDISTNSSDGGGDIGDKKPLPAAFRVDARPLIVGQGGKPAAVPTSISEASTTSLVEDAGGGDESGDVNGGDDMKRADKAFLIANELLTTERHYVSRLHLIDQVNSEL